MSVATAGYTIVAEGAGVTFTPTGRRPQPWVLVSIADALGGTAAVVAELVAVHGDTTRIYFLGASGRVCELLHRGGRYIAAARAGVTGGLYCGRCNFLLNLDGTTISHEFCPHCGPAPELTKGPVRRVGEATTANYHCRECGQGLGSHRHECPACGSLNVEPLSAAALDLDGEWSREQAAEVRRQLARR